MAPSALYTRMYTLAESHAKGHDLLALRSPTATHSWAPNRLVSLHPALQDKMDNAAFAAHLKSSGRYLDFVELRVGEIVVDEHQRRATVRMSYFMRAGRGEREEEGEGEVVEHDLVWLLRFTDGGDGEEVLIEESVEYIDASAGKRLGELILERFGAIGSDVRGSILVTY